MEQCRGKVIYDTRQAAERAMEKLIAETIDSPDDPLLENLNVYRHESHHHIGHKNKTPLQALLITVRRYRK